MITKKEHWEKIYTEKTPQEVSWTQVVPEMSLTLFNHLHLPKNAAIIDIGGGESYLVDNLLKQGYSDITVLDISEKALEKTKKRLGKEADKIKWIVSDILHFTPDRNYDCWHDRATFHFMVNDNEKTAYRNLVNRYVTSYFILGTFSTTGPKKCSGLDICQYEEASMLQQFPSFHKVECDQVTHITPFNTEQNFQFCVLQKSN